MKIVYNYQTRQALFENHRAVITADMKLKTESWGDQDKLLAADILQYGSYSKIDGKAAGAAKERFLQEPGITPSVFMKKYYKKVVEAFVPEQQLPGYYFIIDQLNRFPYKLDYHHTSGRSREYAPHMERVLSLLYAYAAFTIFSCEMQDYLAERLPEELLDYKRNSSFYEGQQFSYLIAAEISTGCEACSGTTEAFITVFDVIVKNNMVRFSSVKRTVSTWAGIFDEVGKERISEKLVRNMQLALGGRKGRWS